MVNKANTGNNKLRFWNGLNLIKYTQNYKRCILFSIISIFALFTVFLLINAYPTGNARAELYPFIASTRGII